MISAFLVVRSIANHVTSVVKLPAVNSDSVGDAERLSRSATTMGVSRPMAGRKAVSPGPAIECLHQIQRSDDKDHDHSVHLAVAVKRAVLGLCDRRFLGL